MRCCVVGSSAIVVHRYPPQLVLQPKEALQAFESKLVDGKVVLENPNRKLAKFEFCKKGQLSLLATKRYRELRKNIDG